LQEKKEENNSKRTRSAIMLLIYAALFLVLIIASRSNSNDYTNSSNGSNATDSDKIQGISILEKENFNYVYTLMVDDKLYTYVGKKYKNKDQYTLEDNESVNNYYTYYDLTLISKNSEYVLTEKPYYLFDYLDINNIIGILNNSKYNETTNIYEISNSKLGRIVGKENTSEELNAITVYYDNKNINKIVMNVTNYASYWEKNSPKVIITLEYSDYNKVDNFNLY